MLSPSRREHAGGWHALAKHNMPTLAVKLSSFA
jgi:hypothetical protein